MDALAYVSSLSVSRDPRESIVAKEILGQCMRSYRHAAVYWSLMRGSGIWKNGELNPGGIARDTGLSREVTDELLADIRQSLQEAISE